MFAAGVRVAGRTVAAINKQSVRNHHNPVATLPRVRVAFPVSILIYFNVEVMIITANFLFYF